MQSGLLPRFFESVTRQAFGDLGIDDAPALRYLTDLLTRFVRTEQEKLLRMDGELGSIQNELRTLRHRIGDPDKLTAPPSPAALPSGAGPDRALPTESNSSGDGQTATVSPAEIEGPEDI